MAKYPYVIDCASIDGDTLDGAALAADGCTGVIARAEWGMVLDKDFPKHRAAAMTAGLMWGGYFAPRWDEPIEPQVAHFLAALGKRTPGTFCPWIDVEEGPRNFDGQPRRVVVAKWNTALDMFIAAWGDAGTYSSARVIHEGLGDPDLSALAPKSKLWLAKYGKAGYYTVPPLPKGWPRWDMCQFVGDSPHVPGVIGKVDLSRFNPLLPDMRAYFDGQHAPGWAKVPA